MMVTEPQAVAVVPNERWDRRIQVCRYGQLVDVFLIVTDYYVILVDTLVGPASALELLALARPQLDGGRELLVINTHSHYDHAWGNQLFAGPDATYPAPLIGTRRCAARLRDATAAAKLRAMQAEEPARYGDTRLVAPTVLFDERLAIDGGDLTLELFLTPGHAPDHVAIFVPQIGTLLAGDAAESPFPFAGSAAELPQIRESLRQMAALDPAHVLYCHAPVTAGPALLRHNLAYFDELERRCAAALAAGVPAAPAEDADLEALVGFPFVAALPPGLPPTDQPDFYRPGHLAHIRMMLEWLSAQ